MAVLRFCPSVAALSSFLRPSRSSHFLFHCFSLQSSGKFGRSSCLWYLSMFVVECPRDSILKHDACMFICCGTEQDLTTGRTNIYPTCDTLRKQPIMNKRKHSCVAWPNSIPNTDEIRGIKQERDVRYNDLTLLM